MPETQRRNSSIYELRPIHPNKRKTCPKIELTGEESRIALVFGVFLTIVTIILRCIAFSTPHWKEIHPTTHSLYINGIDALIRTEILVYFNSIHRFTRQSYGLFERCEYTLTNSSDFNNKAEELNDAGLIKPTRSCSKNFVPSYTDEQFNRCHSLQYYQFCIKTSGKTFDVDQDYLRNTFNIFNNPHVKKGSEHSCECKYPLYISVCQVLEVIAMICLILTALFFGLFSFVETRYQRMKVKCFGVLSSILSSIFMLCTLLIVQNHSNYETTEYLTAIQTHYASHQIYKLSQDTKLGIERFLSSIKIETGYSTKIAWIALFLSVIDGILLMFTCKIKYDGDIPMVSHNSGISEVPNQKNKRDEKQVLLRPIPTITVTRDSRPSSPIDSFDITTQRANVITGNINERSKASSFSSPTNSKRSCLHTRLEDEV